MGGEGVRLPSLGAWAYLEAGGLRGSRQNTVQLSRLRLFATP